MEEQQEKEVRKRRGCLFYGCLTGFVLLVLILLGLLVGGRMLKKMYTDFTDDHPIPLPTVNMPEAEVKQLLKRVDDFRESVRGGKPTKPLELSADEINVLIAKDEDLAPVRGKLYVLGIAGEKIKARLSMPMEEVSLPVFKGRYLNGDATFNLMLKNGIIRLHAEEVTVKGKSVPDVYMQKIRTQNLAQNINRNPRVSVALDWIDSIKVTNGKLVIVPKEKGP